MELLTLKQNIFMIKIFFSIFLIVYWFTTFYWIFKKEDNVDLVHIAKTTFKGLVLNLKAYSVS
jgi:hypothetical protein